MSERRTIRHFIHLQELADREVDDILDLSTRIKRGLSRAELVGRSVGLCSSAHRCARALSRWPQLMDRPTNATSDFWDLESREGR
jgi:hypothetical protein